MTVELVLHQVLEPAPESCALARELVREQLVSHGLDGMANDVVLLTTELVSNAVIHAGTPFAVEVLVGDANLRITVVDIGTGVPGIREPGPLGGGYGLRIVDQLADEWGVVPVVTGGKRVWFSLPLPVTPAEPAEAW